MRRNLMMLTLLGAVSVGMVACDRFEAPTRDQCQQAVSNLVSQIMGAAIQDSIGAAMKGEDKGPGQEVANELIRAVGTSLLVGAGVDDQKIAWCEVNMSVRDANCLRSAQSKAEAIACGYTITDEGAIAEAP